ncbi:MAG: hypothetical protein WHT82_14310, partial [Limisphaera sp.]
GSGSNWQGAERFGSPHAAIFFGEAMVRRCSPPTGAGLFLPPGRTKPASSATGHVCKGRAEGMAGARGRG